jgi:multiple sugar transport system substrate-binding protein
MDHQLVGKGSSRRAVLKGAGAFSALAITGLATPAVAQSKDLTIISDLGNPEQRGVLQRLANEFEKKSGAKVVINNMDHEAHKTAIRSYLVVGPPDLCLWFSGNRMKAFVQRGLFERHFRSLRA